MNSNKTSRLERTRQCDQSSLLVVRPALLQAPEPSQAVEEPLWLARERGSDEFLSVRDSYVIGYYSIIRNKQYGIPANSLSVIEADLRRMEISSAEHRQMLRLLVDSRWHTLTDRLRFISTIHRWDMCRACISSRTFFSRFSRRKKRSSFLSA